MKGLFIILTFLISSTAFAGQSLDLLQNANINYRIKKNQKIRVMIIDSQIDTTHPLVRKFFKDHSPIAIEKGEINHGTHVAGIIAQNLIRIDKNISSKVEFISCNFADSSEPKVDFLKAQNDCFEKALELGVDIINYSGGGRYAVNDYETLREGNLMILLAMSNILLVTAAGNNGEYTEDYFPCNYPLPNIYCVANISKEKELSEKSNFTVNAQFVAVGESILSSLPFESYGYMTGTSQSTPKVSALLIADLLGVSKSKKAELMFNAEIFQVIPRCPASSKESENKIVNEIISHSRNLASENFLKKFISNKD